jgi:hypothetical protein
MAPTMSLMSRKYAGISVFNSGEQILKQNACVMIQNRGGMNKKKIILSLYSTAFAY